MATTVRPKADLFKATERNPEDYLAKQKAQEEEERLEKSKYQRRYGSDKRAERDVTKRRSYIPTHTADEDAKKDREYRQKRRSLNLDKKSDISKTELPSSAQRRSKNIDVEKQSNQTELRVSTDNTDSFAPDSASSPRVSGAVSPRSAKSPPRPSTKRKAAPAPPLLTEQSPSSGQIITDKTRLSQGPQVDSSSSKIPKPVAQRDSKPPTSQKEEETSEVIDTVIETKSKVAEASVTSRDRKPVVVDIGRESDNLYEIEQPSRPPRRKKKPEDTKTAHANTRNENTREPELTANVHVQENSIDKPEFKLKGVLEETKVENSVQNSNTVDEDSLLTTVLKELPSFTTGNQVLNEKPTPQEIKESFSGVLEESISPAVDSGIECEIKPEKVDKQRGILHEANVTSSIELRDKVNEINQINNVDSDDEQDTSFVDNGHRISSDEDEIDSYLDHIKPAAYTKKTGELLQAFEKISSLPETVKDTKDTISIASDISVSSTGSEAPPLPDTAPPSLPLSAVVEVREPLEIKEKEISEVIESADTVTSETSPTMADIIPEISENASPRAVTSPIDELKASMFSMRVTSPTRDLNGERQTNGELTVDTGRRRKGSNSDSDVSDDGFNVKTSGEFTPGERVTKEIPTETQNDDGGIQLLSYSAKLNSPSSDQSAPDSAFEDMQSSVTSNDPLSNTLDELNADEFITMEKCNRVEASPEKEVKSFVLEFATDRPKSGVILSPTGSKNFMAKAQQFAETVQRPPKMTVRRKKEITTPDDLTDERYLQLEAERRAVISSSTMKKKDIVVATPYDEDLPTENQADEDPDTAIQEWRSEVSKRGNISWEEKPEKVNLYSENIIQETENTETVDRESIADLSKARQQWESKVQTLDSGNSTPRKPKQQPQQVRHWEVKLPTQLKKVPANVVRSTRADSDSESENMADMEYSNESAIEREIRLAMEREELLKKEQEERANLQERQMSSLKKEPFENMAEQNNNKPTYHEMTEADRGSELKQQEERIQQEILEQEEREAAIRGSNSRYQDSSPHSSGEEDENANESIIEREIRLQQERERELELRRQHLAKTTMQDTEAADAEVEETVTEEFREDIHASVQSTETPASTPDDLSEAEDQGETKNTTKMRISYEEAISSGAHEGESLIARELREAREREEELQRQRQLAVNSTGKQSQQQKPAPSVKETVVEKTDNPKPSYQKDVGPYKHERKNSEDSISSGHSVEKPQSAANKNVRVATFGGGGKLGGFTYKIPEKPVETKRQETPIEREIRLARERENEFRVAKGLPPLKDEKKLELDEPEGEDIHVTKSSFFSHGTPTRTENIQRFASSRLQKEINKQTELEKKYRDEGKIISTSEEHVGLMKYSDIAQQEYTTPPKRNFSISRKNEPAVSQNGTPEPKQSPKVQTPEQPGPKFNRSISTGGVTFSYKESRHKAESKIEQELREMREREEELRSQRNNAGVVSPSSPRSPDSNSVQNKRSHFEQTS